MSGSKPLCGTYFASLRHRNNLRLNESVVRAQLDTHRLHRQTSRCRAERVEKREKAVDTESIGAEEQR